MMAHSPRIALGVVARTGVAIERGTTRSEPTMASAAMVMRLRVPSAESRSPLLLDVRISVDGGVIGLTSGRRGGGVLGGRSELR